MTNRVFGTKFRGGQKFVFIAGGFFNKREYSGADWLDLLTTKSATTLKIWYCFTTSTELKNSYPMAVADPSKGQTVYKLLQSYI